MRPAVRLSFASLSAWLVLGIVSLFWTGSAVAQTGNLTVNQCALPNASATMCHATVTSQLSGNYYNCIWLTGPTELVYCTVGNQQHTILATTTARGIELRLQTGPIYGSDEERLAGRLLDTDVIRATPFNVAPTVNMTSPAANSTQLGGQPIVLSANASDSDGSVTKVDFYEGNTLLNSDPSAPYSFSWSGVATGSHTVTAVATDNGGRTAQAAVTFTVNFAPSAGMTGPASGTVLQQGAGTTLTAYATDPDSAIGRVVFYANGSPIGEDTFAPFQHWWSPVPNGTHSVTVRAFDIQGAQSPMSSPITVIMNQAPTVSVTSPAANSPPFLTGQTILLRASATDPDGGVGTVEFYDGATLIAADSTAPYEHSWTSATVGAHSVTAKAYDGRGASATSAAVMVNVNQHPPTVQITSPSSGAKFAVGTPITFQASASDVDGTVNRVEFYANGNAHIGTDTSAPYSVVWNGATAGTHTVAAYAVDSAGAGATSNIVSVLVNTPPTASFTAPAAGAVFAPGASITIDATASDPDAGATISKIDFVIDGNPVHSDTSPPFQYVWTGAAAGTHTLSVHATDNHLMQGPAVTRSIRVNALPTVSLTAPATNDTVVVANQAYVVKANASDPDGSIQRVEFYDGAAHIGTDLAPPYEFFWNPVPGGTHTMAARAVDNNDGATASAAVTLIGNQPPLVGLTAPVNNTTYTRGQTIVLAAGASDSDGSIANVVFYDGTTVLATDNTPPFEYGWTSASAGTHTLMARATDNRGTARDSAIVNITVNPQAPSVAFTQPAAGAVFQPGTTITIAANATPGDSPVASVAFYAGETHIGTDYSEPFSINWPTATIGTHVLRAFAYDSVQPSPTVERTIRVNAVPSVGYTSPADGSVHTAGTPILLTAAATDPDGTIKHVDFLRGSELLDRDTTAPYEYSWMPPEGASHTLSVRTSDNDDKVVTSPGPTVNINTRPTASIQAPAAVRAGGNVTLTATAFDAEGDIARIEFYADGNKIGEDSRAPFEILWEAIAAGPHNVKARAFDKDNLGGDSPEKAVFASQLPTIALTAPAANASFLSNETIRMAATATDAEGPVQHVTFFDGDEPLGTDASADGGYTYDLTGAALGTHDLWARVTDSHGLASDSEHVVVEVTSQPPIINLDLPASNGTKHFVGRRVRFQASGSDPDSRMAGVRFNVNGATLPIMVPPQPGEEGGGTYGSYAFDWDAYAPGNYRVSATGVGEFGETSAPTAERTFKVHRPPGLGILAPLERVRTEPGVPITISVEAFDQDAEWDPTSGIDHISITYGEDGGETFGEGQLTPCQSNPAHVCVTHVWQNPPLGLHLIRLRVWDNDGATTTSYIRAPVGVPDFTVKLTAPKPGTRGTSDIVLKAIVDGASDIEYVQFEDYGNPIPTNAQGKSSRVTTPTAGVYEFTYTGPSHGPHRFVAVAHSTLFGDEESEAVQVTVDPTVKDNTPPTAILLAPQTGRVSTGSQVALSASGSDTDGAVVAMEFVVRKNGVALGQPIPGTKDGNNWLATWTAPPPGTYTLTARAYDDGAPQESGESAASTITVEGVIKAAHDLPVELPLHIVQNFDQRSDGVGATAGEFRVDESGAATYSIPIATVPGRAGVAPSLALNYNSQGGSGPLGRGWSLSGTSAITRCRQTMEHGDADARAGGSAPIDFTDRDRFCLDGQRLLLVSDGDAYGANGSEYRTEIDTFARIRAYDPDGQHGPNYFVVQRKDGTTAWYGDRIAPTGLPFMESAAPEMRTDAVVYRNAGDGTAPTSPGPILGFAMTRSMDSFGNYVEYQYINDQTLDSQDRPLAAVGEQLLIAVYYTGKTKLAGQQTSGSEPFASIEFGYDVLPAAEHTSGYASGTLLARKHLLKRITSKSGATQIRHYRLDYHDPVNVTASSERLLHRLTECASDAANAVCYRPTTFAWSLAPHGFGSYGRMTEEGNFNNHESSKLGDVDGDGLLDHVWFDNYDLGACTTQLIRVHFAQIVPGAVPPVNAAELLEWQKQNKDAAQALVMRPAPGQTPNCSLRDVDETPGDPRGKTVDDTWHLIDFDGDGRDDLMLADPENVEGTPNGTVKGRWHIYKSNGRGGAHAFDTGTDLLSACALDGQPCAADHGSCVAGDDRCIPVGPENALVQLADFNGDGLPDVIYGLKNEEGVKVRPLIRFMERDPAFANRMRFGPAHTVELGWESSECAREAQEPAGTGRFFRDCSLALAPSSTRTGRSPRMVDFDADGRADLLADVNVRYRLCQTECNEAARVGTLSIDRSIYQFTVSSIGNGVVRFSEYGRIENGTAGSQNYASAQTGDVNGDGLQDLLLLPTQFGMYSTVEVRLNRGRALFALFGTTAHEVSGRDSLQVVDINADGRADLIHPNGGGDANRDYWLARIAQANGTYGPRLAYFPGCESLDPCFGGNKTLNAWLHFFADFDGDGGVDYMSRQIAGSNDNYGFARAGAADRYRPRDVITKITNGYGAATQILYQPLTNGAVYARESGARFMAPSEFVAPSERSPIQDLLAPLYVVAKVESDAPSHDAPSRTSAVYYQYRGARVQGGGRGLLGFHEVRSIDGNNLAGKHVVTTTEYSQTFPTIGMPLETRKLIVTGEYTPDACLVGRPDATPESCFNANNPDNALHAELSGRLVSYARNRFGVLETAGPADQPARFPYIAASFEATGNVDEAALTTTLTESVSSFEYDVFGNAHVTETVIATGQRYDNVAALRTAVVERIKAESTTQIRCGTRCVTRTQTLADYSDDEAYWRLGRLSRSNVSHWRDGVATETTRTADFTYDLGGTTRTGALVSERVQADLGADQDLRTVYVRDDYGNVTLTLTCSNDIATDDCRDASGVAKVLQRPARADGRPLQTVFRYQRTVYDTAGRFATETRAPFFDPSKATQAEERATTTVTTRDVLGNATRTESANGMWVSATFGPLGRPQRSSDAAGAAAATEFHWCTGMNDGQREAACPPGAVFRQTSYARGGTRGVTYFDRLGRPFFLLAESFGTPSDGNWVAKCTTYDARGRTVAVSEPFFAAVSDGGLPGVTDTLCSDRPATRTEYDAFDRATLIALPEDAPGAPNHTRFNYRGLTTVTYTQVSRVRPREMLPYSVLMTETKEKDAAGLVTAMVDNDSLRTEYGHDATGNLVSITRNAGNGPITTTVGYDALGRKTTQADPDAGTSTWHYNAAGELICSTDARGVSTITDYDALGRAWRTRAEPGTCAPAQGAVALTDGEVLGMSLTPGTSRQVDATFFDTASNGQGLAARVVRRHVTGPNYESVEQWQQSMRYDLRGRPSSATTVFKPTGAANDETYTQSTTYDTLGRVATTTDATGGVVENMYSSHGFLRRIRDDQSGLVYWELLATDARGQATEERRHDNVRLTTRRTYDATSGRLQAIRTGEFSGSALTMAIQDLAYQFDAQGNLMSRTDERLQRLETFTYDGLNRLTKVQLHSTTQPSAVPFDTMNLTYDTLGNICSKNGRSYSYAGLAGCAPGGQSTRSPHAVTGRTLADNDSVTYLYDAAGNQTDAIHTVATGNDRHVRYDVNGLADRIRVGQESAPSTETQFRYAPGGRYLRVDVEGAVTTVTRYVGNVEWITKTGSTTSDRKRYIGGFLILTETGTPEAPVREYRYSLSDHLGSLDVLVDEIGNVKERLSFDAHGNRRATSGTDAWRALAVGGYAAATTKRGFTGHEHLDRAGIVHMNGRLYDAALGRMLSPDPVVQEPFNAQNLNRYTYVLNNPLSFTDPTGLNFVKRYWRQIAAAVISYYMPVLGQYLGVNATVTAVATGFVSGAVSTGSLQGALVGAFTAGITSGITGSNLTPTQQAFARAAAGGVVESLQGGKFAHGFWSAGVGALMTPALAGADDWAGEIAVAALIGGTSSVLSGGKFGNGAATSALAVALGGASADDESPVTGAKIGSGSTSGTYEETARAQTVHVETMMSAQGENLSNFVWSVHTRLQELTQATGHEHRATFAQRRSLSLRGEEKSTYAAVIATAASPVVSAPIRIKLPGFFVIRGSDMHTHGFFVKGNRVSSLDAQYLSSHGQHVSAGALITTKLATKLNKMQHKPSDQDLKHPGAFLSTPSGIISY